MRTKADVRQPVVTCKIHRLASGLALSGKRRA
jgi:hypothetical protein